MSVKRKVLIGGAVVLVGATLALLNLRFARAGDPEVDVERIARRNLAAIVSASGTVEPQLAVDISSSVMGRVTRLAVAEGERVAAGQFLLQIDPESLRAAVDSGAAALRAAESGLDQARVAVETARVNLERAREQLDRQQELWELRLVSRDDYDAARRDVELRETEFRARTVEVATAGQRVQQEQALLDSAEYDLTQVTITSPIDGVVTRLNIEEGETVVIGTMNNPGTVLMTIADFSILEAHVEVDETDIPSVRLGQPAEVTVDALPGRTYRGLVTEIGNSPLPSEVAGSQATNFRVVVTLDGDVPGVRPGFTATADITTATRTHVVAVPIQSATIRDVSPGGRGVGRATGGGRRSVTPAVAAAQPPGEPQPAPEPVEVEGVFVVRGERAAFVPIATGIAGDRYFEAVSGLDAGELVVTGPFDVVRALEDGDAVRIHERPAGR